MCLCVPTLHCIGRVLICTAYQLLLTRYTWNHFSLQDLPSTECTQEVLDVMQEELEVMQEVLEVMQEVLDVMQEQLEVMQEVLDVMQEVLDVMQEELEVNVCTWGTGS